MSAARFKIHTRLVEGDNLGDAINDITASGRFTLHPNIFQETIDGKAFYRLLFAEELQEIGLGGAASQIVVPTPRLVGGSV